MKRLDTHRLMRICRERRVQREDGFVVVIMSLMLTVLFLMAGFAVDLGYWYLRAAQVQRAADAAALSGSIDLPDGVSAVSDALASAQKNGFINGVNDVSVSATPTDEGRLDVTIKDPHVPAFFTRLVQHEISITRSASAARLATVPMGTPFNILGSGNEGLDSGIPEQHFRLAVNGYCTPKEEGDLFLAGFDGNRRFATTADPNVQPSPDHSICDGSGGEVNSDYHPTGYNYSITVPPHTPGVVNVSLYDPAYRPWGCGDVDKESSFPNDSGYWKGGYNASGVWEHDCSDGGPAMPNQITGNPQLDTVFTLFDTLGTDSTTDDVKLFSKTYGYDNNNTTGSIHSWVPYYSLPINTSAFPHRYRLNVYTQQESNSYGRNEFGIVADRSWNWDLCDSRIVADCPQVSGDGAMSIEADAVSDTGYDTFYLAQIDPSYAGTTMTVTLWDPGEKFNEIRLIAPDGSVVPVRWNAVPSVSGTPSGAVYNVDVGSDSCPSWSNGSPRCPQPGPNRYSGYRLNDRQLIITAKIPDNYSTMVTHAGGNAWWSVQYQSTGDPNDRTTWQVSIGGGEPVHLVPTS